MRWIGITLDDDGVVYTSDGIRPWTLVTTLVKQGEGGHLFPSAPVPWTGTFTHSVKRFIPEEYEKSLEVSRTGTVRKPPKSESPKSSVRDRRGALA